MPTVFVTQANASLNFAPAAKFGEVKVMIPPRVQMRNHNQDIIKILDKALAKFKTDEDHLILTGDPLIMGVASALAFEYGDGIVQFLKWDRFQEDYIQVTLNIQEDLDD